MGRDGAGLRRLTDHPGIDVSPTGSPTGREIAFTSNRTGSPLIYAMDDEGLNLRRVSLEGSYNAEPAWSPSTEVSEIAYASRSSSESFDIAVLDLLTRRARRLRSDGSVNDSPGWAPTGSGGGSGNSGYAGGGASFFFWATASEGARTKREEPPLRAYVGRTYERETRALHETSPRLCMTNAGETFPAGRKKVRNSS